MAKVKKNKQGNSDAHVAKKTKANPAASMNPFELHVNKEKFKIIGRKCNHDKGLPGVSRSKALKKRKETLGKEYLQLNKTNKFSDMRIGKGFFGRGSAHDSNEDTVVNARFVAEKLSQMRKNKDDLYNLNDDEILTHRGQTLEEIEQFRDAGTGSDDDDDDDEGNDELNADFTKAAHFGGQEDSHGREHPTDRKAIIEEMIAESKRKKAEIAKEKDAINELTHKLDTNYKSLIPTIGKLNKNDKQPKPKPDDYDRALREMIFEPRGDVADKVKSEEEIAREEKERLEELEKERQLRMNGEDEADKKPKHRSADDLDDGYFLDAQEDSEEERTIAYDLNSDADEDDSAADDAGDDKIIGNYQTLANDDFLLGARAENGYDKKQDQQELNPEQSEDNSTEEEESSEEDNDNLSDLKDDESSDAENGNTSETIKNKKAPIKSSKLESKLATTDLRQKAAKELPYTYDLPESYEEFSELLANKHPDYQFIIVQRIIKCNHPKIDPINKPKIVTFFTYILQHLNDVFCEVNTENVEFAFRLFDRLTPHIFELVQLNAVDMSRNLIEVIKEKYEDYKQNEKSFPALDTLIYFKLISNIYSTSDLSHPVVTPVFIFISHILSRARVRTRRDITLGLWLVTLYLEFTQLSKRFLPAAFNFLLGITFLAVPKRQIEIISIVPPFQSNGPYRNLIVLDRKSNSNECEYEPLMSSKDFVTEEIDDDFKVKCLNIVLKLIEDCVNNLKFNIGVGFLCEPFLKLFERLTLESYPQFVKSRFASLKNVLTEVTSKPLKPLIPEEKKPKALRLLEPRILPVFDDKRRPKLSKEKEERAILIHKVKRETKTAVREIRRDAAFINNIKLKRQLQSDAERREKVRRIFSDAALQQGELNELVRKKKKM